MTDERYKQIMIDLGMPNSTSLLLALEQVANEVQHEELAKYKKMADALYRIAKWDLPETGEFVDKEKTVKASYGFLYGSNGERDYMRKIAKDVLFC